jgi:hypothetical protein
MSPISVQWFPRWYTSIYRRRDRHVDINGRIFATSYLSSYSLAGTHYVVACLSSSPHYATSRKVAGSIPDEVIGFFNWPNPSSCTMSLGSTQPLTEMSTRNLPGGKGRPAHEADTSQPSVSRLSRKMWEPRRLTALWDFMACNRDNFFLCNVHSMSVKNGGAIPPLSHTSSWHND